jgi:hypothetical protein
LGGSERSCVSFRNRLGVDLQHALGEKLNVILAYLETRIVRVHLVVSLASRGSQAVIVWYRAGVIHEV